MARCRRAEDPDTGLVRFGWRDYNPSVGRFTAPGPARDMRGDDDLYDYCVDDPVSCADPAGLFWFFPALYSALVTAAEASPLLFGAAGATGALGLGLGGSYLAAAGADLAGNTLSHQEIRNIRPQKKSTAAWDGVKEITPYVAATHAAAFPPLLVASSPEVMTAANTAVGALGPKIMAPVAAATGAATAAGQRIGASPYGDKILKGVTHAAQFAEPFVVPGLPMVPSAPGTVGAVMNEVRKWYQEQQNRSKD